ncbi:MAG: superkiller [Vezdaea aestivalis]|nr:MAG: superkiller [Vezdaea aestivalis]
MSKQYLTLHTIDNAQPTDIFGLAATKTQVFAASGSSSLKIFSTKDFELAQPFQVIEGAHKLGCHHIVAAKEGSVVASVGFGGEIKLWKQSQESTPARWIEGGSIQGTKAGEIWAIALTSDGGFLVSTAIDGRINVWNIEEGRQKIREFETKGNFGMCIDISPDGQLTASGHENGNIYVFNNDTGRLLHSLPGKYLFRRLVSPVRAIGFSPGGLLLAAAGDSKIIGLYDCKSGEQVASLNGHGAWILSLDWSNTGEYLLSGSFDGKVKVWSIDHRVCVATHSETDKALWSVKWLPKTGKSEVFATAGANRSVSFYREASGS